MSNSTELIDRFSEDEVEEVRKKLKKYMKHRRAEKTHKRKKKECKREVKEMMKEHFSEVEMPVKLSVTHNDDKKKITVSHFNASQNCGVDKEALREAAPEMYEQYLEITNEFPKVAEYTSTQIQESDNS